MLWGINMTEQVNLADMEQIDLESMEMHPETRLTRKQFVLSNQLIESTFMLPIVEQRILMAYLSKLTPNDAVMPFIRMTAAELMQMCGDTSMRPNRIDEATDEIMTHIIKLQNPDGSWIKFSWFTTAEYSKGGVISLRINPDLEPYLIQLKEKFTQLMTDCCMRFRSPYSVRMYQLMKEYQKIKRRSITVDELRLKMAIEAEKYEVYKNFKARVINQALKEINEKSDIYVVMEEFKAGNKVTELTFYITENDHAEALPGLEEYYAISRATLVAQLVKEILRVTGTTYNIRNVEQYSKKTIIELLLTLKRGVYNERKIAVPQAYFTEALEKIERGEAF